MTRPNLRGFRRRGHCYTRSGVLQLGIERPRSFHLYARSGTLQWVITRARSQGHFKLVLELDGEPVKRATAKGLAATVRLADFYDAQLELF